MSAISKISRMMAKTMAAVALRALELCNMVSAHSSSVIHMTMSNSSVVIGRCNSSEVSTARMV